MIFQIMENADSFIVRDKYLKDKPVMVFSKSDKRFDTSAKVARWLTRNYGATDKDFEFKTEKYDRKKPREMNMSKLEKARIEKGLTQKQLSELIGIQQSRVSDYERGIHTPSVKVAIKLSDALGIEIKEILYGA